MDLRQAVRVLVAVAGCGLAAGCGGSSAACSKNSPDGDGVVNTPGVPPADGKASPTSPAPEQK